MHYTMSSGSPLCAIAASALTHLSYMAGLEDEPEDVSDVMVMGPPFQYRF